MLLIAELNGKWIVAAVYLRRAILDRGIQRDDRVGLYA